MARKDGLPDNWPIEPAKDERSAPERALAAFDDVVTAVVKIALKAVGTVAWFALIVGVPVGCLAAIVLFIRWVWRS